MRAYRAVLLASGLWAIELDVDSDGRVLALGTFATETDCTRDQVAREKRAGLRNTTSQACKAGAPLTITGPVVIGGT